MTRSWVRIVVTVFVILAIVIVSRNTHINSNLTCVNCNVILISLDTVGANHLPCYGYFRNTMPHLCSYARKHLQFQNAYASASWTLPSDVTLFTSRYPAFHKILNYDDINLRLRDTNLTLHGILHDWGYQTIFSFPLRDRAFPTRDIYYRGISQLVPSEDGPPDNLSLVLKKFRGSIEKGNRTFLFLHSYQAHGAYIPYSNEKLFTSDFFANIPVKSEEIYQNFSQDFYQYLLRELPKEIGRPNSVIDPTIYDQLKNAHSLSDAARIAYDHTKELDTYFMEFYYFSKINLKDPRQVEYIKALYDQKLFEIDTWIGETLIPFLEDPKIRNNTIVLITAEHGEEFLEHGRLGHETLYDTNERVPFIFAYPGDTPQVVYRSVGLIDVMPTILGMLNIDTGSLRLQGENVLSFLSKYPKFNRLMFADSNQTLTARFGPWKLFMRHDKTNLFPYELYDIGKDPGEGENILSHNLGLAKRLQVRSLRYEKYWRKLLRLEN